MADEEDGWALTESDPLLFTQLLKDIGVKGLQVDDLYSLDAAILAELQPIHALIFLFKWVGGGSSGASSNGGEEDDEHLGVYFANQVINNSCGTLAALNAVMNIPPKQSEYPDEVIEHGPELDNLREFGAGMDSMSLGHLITNSSLIRETHNSFTSSSPFSIAQNPLAQHKKQDAYHFVTYVPVLGQLWELDGLRNAPIKHGPVDEGKGEAEGEGWVKKAREVIEKRIATYPEGSLMFNLLCVRTNPLPALRRQLSSPSTPTHLIPVLSDRLAAEEAKLRRGQLENGLRRHNCIPLVIELVKAMSKAQGKEPGKTALEESREKAKEIAMAKRARGEDTDME